VPDDITSDLLRSWPLPRPDEEDDKHARGQVLVVGGSVSVPGAVLLSGLAALRSGAGKLQVATTASTAVALAVAMPEALVAGFAETDSGAIDVVDAVAIAAMAAGVEAVLIGPGFVDPGPTGALVHALIDAMPGRPMVVIDAGAIPALAGDPGALAGFGGRAILTPNTGELALLLGVDSIEGSSEREEAAMSAAAKWSAVVAARGFIAAPDGRSWRSGSGGVGLATSGSGDVLSGLVAGLSARGAEPAQAAAWGVHAHGRAGERLAARMGRVGFLARELIDELPLVLSELAP
jgi:hydroxyethylthiazole kinase-like uncharacterized protein yjeF